MTNKMEYVRLTETKLWKCYSQKAPGDSRTKWIKDIYYNAIKQLMTVRDTFSNYTLHDETHIINVMEAIGGLLGKRISDLTIGEIELLILSTCLHDIGMVYTSEEKRKWLKNASKCNEFIRKNNPELIGVCSEDWSESIKQNYFRWLHPFRISEVLAQVEWSELFENRPGDIISKQTIIAVCQAHGESLSDINLPVSKARNIDVLFCAVMLRLGDLLDFDDSRAPQILYKYASDNIKSKEEWDKHKASILFNYPDIPSTEPLPYTAECFSPGIEHSVRNYLDWIDDELSNCRKMQSRFHERWSDFPFPYEVDKEEIEAVGYESGDFKLTMAQEQIMDLLIGQNLYESSDVFVRELLQNSIDATLLRGKMDTYFHVESEDARIDLWEWNDNSGKIWFRIDDRGIGMTKGMLQRYFLKIGNSYYNSDELKRDLRDHRQEDYHSISRFGIGFLSCFLCGENAEISTLYFEPEKNRRENHKKTMTSGYGIRMNITGLTGYYVMQNQASGHIPEKALPSSEVDEAYICKELELDNYRQEPGTSIVICIDPGKLGGINLRDAVEKYLCFPRMPVYYNGEKVGMTYQEFMDKFHDGKMRTYQILEEDKAKFDEIFTEYQGQYPELQVNITNFNFTQNPIFMGLSGVIIKCELCYNKMLLNNKEEFYLERHDEYIYLKYYSYITMTNLKKNRDMVLKIKLDGEIYQLIKFISSKTLSSAFFDGNGSICAYHGIIAGVFTELEAVKCIDTLAICFLENEQQPKVDVGRTRVSELPLESLLAVCSLLYKLKIGALFITKVRFEYTLTEFRELRDSSIGKWALNMLNLNGIDSIEAMKRFNEMKYSIGKGEFINEFGIALGEIGEETVTNNYILAYFQDMYELTVDYEKKQYITFSEKKAVTARYDLFPPMMFCNAKDDNSRQYLCSKNKEERICITANHPYTEWLLNNAFKLNHHFNRQFKQIVTSLNNENADVIILTVNAIREQLLPIAEARNINISSCPILTERDFWEGKKEVEISTIK